MAKDNKRQRLLTDTAARYENVGGEVICYVW